MHVGTYEARIMALNKLGGGLVEIIEKPYKGLSVGFNKMEGFKECELGQVVKVFLTVGHVKTVRRVS